MLLLLSCFFVCFLRGFGLFVCFNNVKTPSETASLEGRKPATPLSSLLTRRGPRALGFNHPLKAVGLQPLLQN